MNLEKTDIRKVLSGIYGNACLDESCDMRELAFVLEGLAEVYGEYPTLQAWKKVKIDRERFEKEAYYNRILEFRKQVNKKFLDKAVAEIRQRTEADRGLGFDLWFEVYTQALEFWEGEIFGNLCEYGFDFKAKDLEKISEYKSLNLLVLDEKWPEVYKWFLDFAENGNLPDSRRSNFYLYSAQVIQYYFGYPDKVKALIDRAKQVFSENILVKRVRAESLIVSKDFEQARSLLLNAINADPNHIENYHYLGDSYLNEEKFETAEQWYNDALHINFLDPLTYTKLINLGGVGGTSESDLPEMESLFEKAIRFLEEGKFENYLYILHREMGNAFHKAGKHEKSVQYYLKSVELKPDLSSAKIELAYVFINHSSFEEGEKWFKAAIDHKQPKNNFAAYWGLGWLYECAQLNDPRKAIEYYSKCIGLRIVGDDRVYNVIGNLHFSLNEFEKSAEFYRKAIEEYPLEIVYHNNLKGALDNIGNPELLADYYDDLVKYFPTESLYFNDAGVLHYEQGNLQKAIVFYNRAIEISPNTPVFWENRAISYEALGKFDEAIADYSSAGKLNEDPFIFNSIGRLYYWKDNFESAIENYTKAIDLDSSVAVFYENRALAYRDINNFELAEKDFLDALSMAENKNTYNYLGIIKLNTHRFEEAVEYFSKAINLSPSEFVFWENRALANEYLGWNKDAYADFEKALTLNESPVSYNGIGKIKYWDSDFEAACSYFSKAAELDPENEIYRNNLEMARHNTGLRPTS